MLIDCLGFKETSNLGVIPVSINQTVKFFLVLLKYFLIETHSF